MTDIEARRGERCPSHPGALLADILPATGRSKVEIAGLLGISRQQLYDILGECRPVSPQMAARLDKLFGDGAAVWLRMQAAYDDWQAEHTVDVSDIPTIRASGVAPDTKHPRDRPVARVSLSSLQTYAQPPAFLSA